MPNNENHTTIRIRTETYKRLKLVSAQLGRSMVSLIEEWVSEAENQHKRAGKRAPKKSERQTPRSDAE